MEDKIEIGEYVRTKAGNVDKIKSIKENEILFENSIIKYTQKNIENMVVKHSKNIIDLIEEGDYVNGYKILRIEEMQNSDRKLFVVFKFNETEHCEIWRDNEIKTIVTKEMMTSIEYKVGV